MEGTPSGFGAFGDAPAGGRTGLRRLIDYPLFYCGLAIFGVSCLLWSLPAALLYRVLPARIGAPLGRFMIMAGFRYFIGVMHLMGLFRCDLRALDALRDQGAMIIAPNHPSLLDAVLVISRLPRIVCIIKAPLWDNVFLGGGSRLAGYIRNDAPVNLIRQAVRQLRAGNQLLIFPEGTRSSAVPVGPFKGGFALMAAKAGIPVQTVFLESNTSFLGKGWSLFRKPEFPLIFRARLGRRFEVSGELQDFVTGLETYYRQELAAGPGPRRDAA